MTDVDPTSTALAVLSEILAVHPDAWTDGPLDELALRLHRLRFLQGVTHRLGQDVEQALIDSMETDSMISPHVGQLRRVEHGTSTWKFKHSGQQLREDLTNSVSNNIAVDIATGDIDPMKRNIARATMQLALEAIPAFSNLNKAGRERLGLHIADYREYATSYRIVIEATEDDD